jgi:general secretion pathway protein D
MYNEFKLVCIGLLTSLSLSMVYAETVQVANPEIEKQLLDNFERDADQLRKDTAKKAEETVRFGKELVSQMKFEEAATEFAKALESFNKIGGDYVELKKSQLNSYLASFRIKWANTLMDKAYKAFSDKNFDLAVIKAREAQGVEKLPKARKDKIQDFIDSCERKMDSVEFSKKTALTYKDVDPDNTVRNDEIHIAMKNADTLLNNGRYVQARDALEKILVRDPYNFKATEKLKKLYKRLTEVGKIRRKADLYERMSEVQWKWSEPVLPVPAQRPDKAETIENKDASGLSEKLSRLVLQEVSFTDANIQAVVKFLAQESKRVDVIDGTGINIVLGIDEAEIDNVPLVTMNLENMPMNEVIRYLCQMCNLKYRIEEQVLTIGNDSIDEMDTKFFKVRSALITRIAPVGDSDSGDDSKSFDEEDFFDADETFKDSENGGGASSKHSVTSEALKSYFRDRGIQFPEGATIAYSRRSGKLTVKNSHENLRRLDTLLRALDVEQPQVLIESKFLEVSQEDIEEMGFEWWLEPIANTSQRWNISENNTLVRPLGTNKDGADSPVNQDVTGRIINDMVFPALKLGENFGNFNVHMMLHALDLNASTEVLSAPKVIAKNGEEATIRMVREEYYPESWTAPELVIVNGQFSYTPPTPEFGEPSDIGIRLIVTPTVSPDNHTISLALNPQVVQRTGWTDYSVGYRFGPNSGNSLVKMPARTRRDIMANVKTYDGDTLVLGGMLTEGSASTDDSYPGTQKVPLLGFLGRVQTKQHTKTNLMIFVTARIVNPDGLPIRISADNGLFDFRR